METKVKGNYSASARKHTYECLDSQVPVDKTSDLLCFVAYNICKQTLKDLPNTSTSAKAAFELKVFSDLQVSETLLLAKTAKLGWDAT